MGRRDHIEWLLSELPRWVEAGLISPEVAERVRGHYALALQARKSWLQVILLAVGGLLVGGGIVMLFAYNWENITRPWRVVLSYIPLLGSIWGSFRMLVQDEENRVGAREGWAAFHSLAVAACLGLVAQTYHLGGTFDTFLLTWALLVVPLTAVMEAAVPAVLSLAAFAGWSVWWANQGGSGLWLWLLWAAALAMAWPLMRRASQTPRTAFVSLAGVLVLFVALGLTFSGADGGWMADTFVVYVAVCSALYVIGSLMEASAYHTLFAPARVLGFGGAITLALLASFQDFVRALGSLSAAFAWRMQSGSWAIVIVTIAALLAWAGGVALAVRKGRYDLLWVGALPLVLGALCWDIRTLGKGTVYVSSLYLVAAGVAGSALGTRDGQAARANAGLAVLLLAILLRFFDAELSLLTKGVAFVVVGVLFLLGQRILGRMLKRYS